MSELPADRHDLWVASAIPEGDDSRFAARVAFDPEDKIEIFAGEPANGRPALTVRSDVEDPRSVWVHKHRYDDTVAPAQSARKPDRVVTDTTQDVPREDDVMRLSLATSVSTPNIHAHIELPPEERPGTIDFGAELGQLWLDDHDGSRTNVLNIRMPDNPVHGLGYLAVLRSPDHSSS